MANGDPAVPENEVIAGFQAMLEELKVNSRPHLTTLTILAGEYREYANQIVGLIETRLNRVRRYRLPIMYLIDSIIKEFPEEYVPIFSENLVSFFAETFANANPARERTKLYELRTTWDDVFQARVLYNLDVKIKQIDSNWPVRVKRNGIKKHGKHENGNISSSDEFSSSGSEAGMDVSNPLRREPRPRVGTTGIPVSNGRTMNDMISPPTPVSHSKTPRTPHSSVHSSPRINDQFGPAHQRKSRPPSTMTSPMSIDGAHHPGDHRPQRFRSLDERVSSLEAESRQHTDISDLSDDDKLEIVENVPPASVSSPATNKMERSLRIPRLGHSRFESPKSGARRGSGNSSTVSSPHNRDSSSTMVPSGKHRAERGIQVKASCTTRAIQTGQFTRESSTETIPLQQRDQATQKKLRKPKQCHFSHQFTGNRGRANACTQVEQDVKASSTQWDERDVKHVSTAHDRLTKGFEFRNCVTRFCENGSSRMADSILRRLHDQQKRTQFCDLTINCDGKQFRAHKVVIAAVSEVVEREAWMSDEVTLRAIQANVMQKLIDYCYTQMLGPFTSKHEVEHLVKAITDLKIRQLDGVRARLKEGLSKDTDYIGSAISGNELISAEIVTAAMIGHTLPPVPSSSYGLADLEETGFNGTGLPESDDELEEQLSGSVPEEPIKIDESKPKHVDNTEPLQMIDEETRKRMPHKKRIVALAKQIELVQDSSSSSDSTVSTTSSEGDENMRVKPTRRPKRASKPITTRKPEISPSRVPKKRKAAVELTPKVVKDDVSTPKRPRRRTNEGVSNEHSNNRSQTAAEKDDDSNVDKRERRGRPRKFAPVFTPTAALERDISPASSTSPSRVTRSGRLSPAKNDIAVTKSSSPVRSPRVKLEIPVDTIQQIIDDEKAEDMLIKKPDQSSPVVPRSPRISRALTEKPRPELKEKPIEKSEVKYEPIRSPVVALERLTADTLPELKEENDQDDQLDKRRSRRKTIATKSEIKPKDVKREPKPKTPRRKSIAVIIPAFEFECPYDDEVSANLRLTGDEFKAATGRCMKVAYLQHMMEQTTE